MPPAVSAWILATLRRYGIHEHISIATTTRDSRTDREEKQHRPQRIRLAHYRARSCTGHDIKTATKSTSSDGPTAKRSTDTKPTSDLWNLKYVMIRQGPHWTRSVNENGKPTMVYNPYTGNPPRKQQQADCHITVLMGHDYNHLALASHIYLTWVSDGVRSLQDITIRLMQDPENERNGMKQRVRSRSNTGGWSEAMFPS